MQKLYHLISKCVNLGTKLFKRQSNRLCTKHSIKVKKLRESSFKDCVVKIHQGGGVAAPIASQVFGEVLPYLEIKKDNEQEEEKQEIEVPNIIGMTEKEAKKALEDVGLNLEIKESQEDNKENNMEFNDDSQDLQNTEKTITEQLPKAGIKIKQGTSVVSYMN